MANFAPVYKQSDMSKFGKCPSESPEAVAVWKEMMSGRRYDALSPHLTGLLAKTRERLWEFNNCRPSDAGLMNALLDEILGSRGKFCHINQPFRCDYGCNISVGEYFFANFNLTILDEAEVEIGCHCFIGPNVSIFTACHPLEAEERNKGTEWAEPVKIGDNVWIGGDATILPGVTIGDNAVIGAGSVVTRDVPPGCVYAGNPARLIRKIK